MIRLAEITDLESVLQITRNTISEIYSHYYAGGVVDFFLKHHSKEIKELEQYLDCIVSNLEEAEQALKKGKGVHNGKSES